MPTARTSSQRLCVLNVGLFRTGTTTLAKAFENYGLKSHRCSLEDLSGEQIKDFLLRPGHVVSEWACNGGFSDLVSLLGKHDYVCDGWCPLLPFLPQSELDRLVKEAMAAGTKIQLIATTRNIESLVKSELHHWVVHDLETRSGLSPQERMLLESHLRERSQAHRNQVGRITRLGVAQRLHLDDIENSWPPILSGVGLGTADGWKQALLNAGEQNASPALPVEGILLTFRLGGVSESKRKCADVQNLLQQLERDSICRYLVVLAVDEDEWSTQQAQTLISTLRARAEEKKAMRSLQVIVNPKQGQRQPFPICSVWHDMAAAAWQNGADWVVLLGDDIKVHCSFHYRAFYREFLNISDRLGVQFGFGCPWWNDETFPNFPSFPCVGKAHYDIFGGLIPQHRHFVNQDLDPYLHRLYSKFWASPCVRDARLQNTIGGDVASGSARYCRVSQSFWRDFAVEDSCILKSYVASNSEEAVLVDVVVPSFRVNLDFLTSICAILVPEYMQTLFIIIIDNPEELLRVVNSISHANHTPRATTLDQGEQMLEQHLSKASGNAVRVRCNKMNLGASGSRNRGLDESAADFVLNLDDDLIPQPDILKQYGNALLREGMVGSGNASDVAGLIGLVRFPRSPTLPLCHAAVLMSYLTFMFEIAEQNLYPNPAWGVTANILFRRNAVRFDLAYAKTGGGEDVDYALRVCESLGGGKLVPVPSAKVVHPFWSGSFWKLASHFFNWAIGDGSLLRRFPQHRYWSFPNLPETVCILVPMALVTDGIDLVKIVYFIPLFLIADFLVDFSNRTEFRHRCLLLQRGIESDIAIVGDGTTAASWDRGFLFYLASHVVANIYVVILECGRLYGHLSRSALFTEGFCRRFDWHCGKLSKAPRNFRKREALKFYLFVAIVVVCELFD